MSITISGIVPVRNAFNLDYTLAETVESLLPVCDEVVISDGESTDGTQEFIRDWMTREPKIKLCVYDWPNPNGDVEFYVTWLQSLRAHASCQFILQLDCDEILHERSYQIIEDLKKLPERASKHGLPLHPFSLWCHRYNFWRDTRSLIPHGVCCSHRVVRVAPQNVWLPSDGPHPLGAEAIGMAINSEIELFHYGFLRKRDAFFAKARALQSYFFNSYDPRLAAVEREQILTAEAATGNWMVDIKDVEWTSRLVNFTGSHPALGRKWLAERGYVV